jgi:membrane protein DedA with SNARE-associated domain
MIWLSTVSLVAGGLLARRFKIIVLAPATFVIVVMAIVVGQVQTADIWSIVFTTTVASVGIQIGYFFGMLIQYGLRTLLVRGSSPSSDNRTARPPSIFRTPISR